MNTQVQTKLEKEKKVQQNKINKKTRNVKNRPHLHTQDKK
jgi:hypothetical protein